MEAIHDLCIECTRKNLRLLQQNLAHEFVEANAKFEFF